MTNLSDSRVEILGADGVTPDGIPYYDFSEFVANGKLEPDEISGSPTIAFLNRGGHRFSYELVFYTKPTRLPKLFRCRVSKP
ncbi:MAG: hypothetical protein R3C03_17705 [Pirellulaceae bacterium]